MTDKQPLNRIEVQGRQLDVRCHESPPLTAVFGDDCVLLIWLRPDDDGCDADAFVLNVDYAREVAKGITTAAVNWFALQRDVAEAGELSPDQFRDDEDDT